MIRDNTIIIIIIIIYYYCIIMALDNSESWKAGLNKKGVSIKECLWTCRRFLISMLLLLEPSLT